MIGPVFKKLSEKPDYAGVDFYTVDGDEQPDIMDELQISSVRTSRSRFRFFFSPWPVDAHFHCVQGRK